MKYFLPISILCCLLIGCGGGSSSDGDGDDQGNIDNRAPVAAAGDNQSTNIGQSVSLSGAGSTDPDGDSLSYRWEIVSSPQPSSPEISSPANVTTDFSADTPGSYGIQLSVSDGSANSTDVVTVTVIDPDSVLPVANAGGGYKTSEGVDIQLDGSASAAPGNGALTYQWRIVSGPAVSTAVLVNANTEKPTFESASLGTYEIELTVTIENGNSATDITTVLVLENFPIMGEVDSYTQVLPAKDTRIIYVSNQGGDDANDGLSPSTPVKSIQYGVSLLRDGYPDWLALKAGDTWETGIGGWRKSGRSAEEPMVITSYGLGESRPLLRTHDDMGLRFQGGGGAPESVDFVVIHGLHFFAASREPGSPDFTTVSADSGILWLRGTNGLLIEDNVFQFYKVGIILQEVDGFDIRNVLIKNNVILDSYGSPGSHSQGIYLESADNIRVERNVIDHAGWNENIEGAEKTKFNHGIYVQTSNRKIDIVDNIITRSSSHGVQLRPGGLMQGNVLVENAISLMLGGDEMNGEPGLIEDNVILHGSDIGTDEPRGWGIDLTANIVSADVRNNIVAHESSVAGDPRAISESARSTETGNAVYNWGSQSQEAALFVDPSITILDLDREAGGDGSLESFYANIRKKSLRDPSTHSAWKYDVDYIKQFFKEGFATAQ